MLYYYQGFGLTITSEIPFPELVAISENEIKDNTQLSIQLGKTPDRLIGEDVYEIVKSWHRPNESLIEIINIAKYYIKDGQSITIEPLTDNLDDVRLFFFQSPITALLHQKKALLLETAGVFHDDKIILFGGATKTHLAAALLEKDFTLFTDNFSVFHQSPAVNASFPVMRLWENTLNHLDNHELVDKTNRARKDFYVYNYSFKEDFVNQPLKVSHLVLLYQEIGIDKIIVEKKQNLMERIVFVTKLVHQQSQHKGQGVHKDIFKTISLIARQPIKMIELKVPFRHKAFKYEQVIQTVLNEI